MPYFNWHRMITTSCKMVKSFVIHPILGRFSSYWRFASRQVAQVFSTFVRRNAKIKSTLHNNRSYYLMVLQMYQRAIYKFDIQKLVSMRLLWGKTQGSWSYWPYNIGVDTLFHSDQNLNLNFSNFKRNEFLFNETFKGINKVLLFHFLKMILTSLFRFRQ